MKISHLFSTMFFSVCLAIFVTNSNAASIYLNDDAGVTVSLNNGALSGGSLANIINADSAIEPNPHVAGIPGTHAYIEGSGAQMDLRFDLGAVYSLQTAHLWNIEEPRYPFWGVTAMKMEFFDNNQVLLGMYNSPPIMSGGNGLPNAEDFDIGGVLGVRYVDVLLTGGTDGVDITNFGLTTVPVPAAIWFFGSSLLGLIGIARRKKPA